MTRDSGRVDEDDDASLVRRCIDRDSDAWARLVERHGPLAWSVIRRAGLSGEDAADVYQTSWLAALESLPRIRQPERFGGWIARTAHIQSVRLRRTYGITRKILGKLPVLEADDRVPGEALVELEERHRVTLALSTVGERCETLLRLLYFQDPPLAYQEVASRLAMPIGSIGPTRARCLEKLERLLGDEGEKP